MSLNSSYMSVTSCPREVFSVFSLALDIEDCDSLAKVTCLGTPPGPKLPFLT